MAPSNAVAFEPVLSVGRSVAWQDIYLGVRDEQASPESPNKTILVTGLIGATLIREAPQGGIIAVIFKDNSVRCFDLGKGQEVAPRFN